MNKLKSLLNSKPILGASSMVFIILSIVAITPVSNFIIHKSMDVVTNFYLVAAVMLLLAASSATQALLVVALVWGKTIIAPKPKDIKKGNEDELDFTMRNMKVTGAKKSFVFGAVLALNIFAFDMVGHGVLVVFGHTQ